MKLSSTQQTLDTSIPSAAEFGIEESDLSHIMGILRSQIYSDKLLAVIREYSTNARDANIEAGNEHRPIHVETPTRTSPQLQFRDYGNGLTDEQVTSLYVKYGASTKRSSNDYTGCLGIGCKAAFAYGDSFTITSYTLDTITTWLARIDESKRGTVSLVSRLPNHTEPTGVNISVTIKYDDFETCESKIRTFFKYWKSDVTSNLSDTLTELTPHHSTDDWAIANHQTERRINAYNHRGAATVVMGNIAYPVPSAEFKDNNIHGLSLIYHDNVIFYAPLGSLDIAANREALELTDRTKTGITSLANNMMLDLTTMLEDTVSSQPTRILASIKSSLFENSLGTSLNRAIASNASWKGQKLIRTISLTNKKKAVIHKRQRSWRSTDNEDRNIREKDVSMITLDDNLTICVTDNTISEANSTRRVRTLQAASLYNRSKQFVVIQRDHLSDVEPVLQPADYTDLLTIDPLKPTRTIITKAAGNKSKQVKINVCTLKPNSLKSARLSKECEPEAMEDGRFVYVPLDRFDWDGHPDRLANLSWIQAAIKSINDNTSITIHGVKKHHISKLGDNWITLDMFFKEKLDQAIKERPAYYKSKADEYECWEKDTNGFFPDLLIMSKVKDKTIAYQAQTLSNAGHTGGASELQVGSFLGVYTNKSTIIKDIKKTLAKYPLLQVISTGYYCSLSNDDIAKAVTHYIKQNKSK